MEEGGNTLTLVVVFEDDVDDADDDDVGRCLFSKKELNFYFFKMSPRSTRTIWSRNSLRSHKSPSTEKAAAEEKNELQEFFFARNGFESAAAATNAQKVSKEIKNKKRRE